MIQAVLKYEVFINLLVAIFGQFLALNSTRPGYSWSVYGIFILPVLVILVPFFYHAYELGNLLGEAKEEHTAGK
ncbi:MAG: hypothetical protein CYPHOPRED_002263, partial [Cyphobasidiales sp. Tagirdzhanova-0007]